MISHHDEAADASAAGNRSLPLTGITVLDLSHVYNGPYAAFLMAMAGARVIKIEPKTGEHLRSRGDSGGAAMAFAMLNSNKESIALNLKSKEGRDLFREMASKADVVIENFSPGTTDRLGIGADALLEINPSLIYASSSGYGKSGPYRDFPAMDLVMQAMSGIISITGNPDEPPVKAGAAVCDFSAGVHLYGAIVTALFERERTGVGRVVDVAMQDSIYASMASNIGMHFASGGKGPTRTGNRHGGLGISPYNVYTASDGYIVLNAPGDHHFRAILKVMGRSDLDDDPRFVSRSSRVGHMLEVDALIEHWTQDRKRDEIARAMQLAGVPCAPVRELGEVMQDENMHERGSLQHVDHPQLGDVVLPHSPMRYEGSAMAPIRPSRPLGADTHAVLRALLGRSDDEIKALAESDVI
jgi:crotonobetainyl-CoA:carnitine CoA-transferase CaiB-like acyl-CoA transferase